MVSEMAVCSRFSFILTAVNTIAGFDSKLTRKLLYYESITTGPDLSVWRPWAGPLLEAPTHPQML